MYTVTVQTAFVIFSSKVEANIRVSIDCHIIATVSALPLIHHRKPGVGIVRMRGEANHAIFNGSFDSPDDGTLSFLRFSATFAGLGRSAQAAV